MSKTFQFLQFGTCEVCGLAQLPEQLSCLMVPLDPKKVRFFTLFYCSDNPQCHLKAIDKLSEKEGQQYSEISRNVFICKK
ncbi:hypothetical protein [Endozoicomonas sp. SCSIO W0465]|uniref:hypothetical protein n=1 Tax=Endozoicomonas sp. SCSIO W0465 TaxID=2918516 RepID=UPI0020765FE8|nr:hypothetical protein [Endozoicomonas sp. SCSIO W0465]USE35776.1 hypothetical protein MJO57_27545 [Endozoicomonas sp. SCSIO W0465]